MAGIKEQLFALNKTSKRSVALYHGFALSAGISDSALGVLYALLEDRELSQYDLCSEWAIPKQTINTTVGTLQKRGLVSLSPASGARNKKCLHLTPDGRAFAQNTVGALLGAECDAFSELSPEERALYVKLNKKYNDALAKKVNGFLSERSEADGAAD